jgi:hypothetical protein
MKLRGLSIFLACVALAACQAVPDNGLHAVVAGSHVDAGEGRIDTFRVTQIDRTPIGRVGTSEPSKTLGIDAESPIAAGRPVHVEFEGLARYSNTMKSFFWSTMHVEGEVDFVPVADARYVVRGEIGTEEGSAVWLENDQTHEVIGRKFVTAPSAAPSAPESHM